MRVLICGDRNWTDRDPIRGFLETLNPHEDIIIHGAARGADRIAGEEATIMGFRVLAFPADWRRLGRSAGPIRNREMADKGLPEMVVAFHDGIEQSRGTADMLTVAKKRGIPAMVVTHDDVSQKPKEGKP